MAQYKVYAGLGGGFGGAKYIETVEAANEEEAANIAYEYAVEEYESYEGLHGLVSYGDIVDNPEKYGLDEYCQDEEYLWEAYEEERSTWLDYYVKEVQIEREVAG